MIGEMRLGRNVSRNRAGNIYFMIAAMQALAVRGNLQLLTRYCIPVQSCVQIRGKTKRGTKNVQLKFDKKDLEIKSEGKYTVKPLKINRMGGRKVDLEVGDAHWWEHLPRIKVNQRVRGGVKFDYYMIDYQRNGPNEADKFYEERILEVRRDPNRSSHIALAAGNKGKRWIIATDNMQAGWIVKTSQYIPAIPVQGSEGNNYPVGALLPGTQVCHIEKTLGEGASEAINAGGCATVQGKMGNLVIVRFVRKHGKREVALNPWCMVTVGRVSNVGWSKLTMGSGHMVRRLGIGPASGLWHKKDGYCGRKGHPIPPLEPVRLNPPPLEKYFVTLSKSEMSANFGTAGVHWIVPKPEIVKTDNKTYFYDKESDYGFDSDELYKY